MHIVYKLRVLLVLDSYIHEYFAAFHTVNSESVIDIHVITVQLVALHGVTVKTFD